MVHAWLEVEAHQLHPAAAAVVMDLAPEQVPGGADGAGSRAWAPGGADGAGSRAWANDAGSRAQERPSPEGGAEGGRRR